MLHTAVLYGHAEMVSFLLTLGADATVTTADRKLTCLHLLAMVPRDEETDASIVQMLACWPPQVKI
jgi:ankyrin repeat protein